MVLVLVLFSTNGFSGHQRSTKINQPLNRGPRGLGLAKNFSGANLNPLEFELAETLA